MTTENQNQVLQKEFYWLGVHDQVDFLGSLRRMLSGLGIPPAQVGQLTIDVLVTLDNLQNLKQLVRDRMKRVKGTVLTNMYELRWDFVGQHSIRYGIRVYFVEETKWIIGLRWQVKPLAGSSEIIRELQNREISKAEKTYLEYRRKEIDKS